MSWCDFLRVVFGGKTASERNGEDRFQEALARHREAHGQLSELRIRLRKVSEDVNARIDLLEEVFDEE